MIKFFKNIRKKLAAENKILAYLMYAVGEILLVVIGILIALQVNNWNIQNQNREKERLSLIEIRDNLISDSTQIKVILEHFKNRQQTIFKTIDMLSREKLSSAERDTLFINYLTSGRLFRNATFQCNNVGFNNMVNSGNIDLLSNTELRKQLGEYYLITNKEFGAFKFTTQLSRELQKYIFPLTTDKKAAKKYFGLNLPINESFDLKKVQTPKTFTYLFQLSGNINYSAQVSIEVKNDVKTLIEMISNELESFEK